jgi:hypothetical protein
MAEVAEAAAAAAAANLRDAFGVSSVLPQATFALRALSIPRVRLFAELK